MIGNAPLATFPPDFGTPLAFIQSKIAVGCQLWSWYAVEPFSQQQEVIRCGKTDGL
jgi:hypothetical protein